MKLTENLKELLFSHGADLVGVGDMSGVEICSYPVGISVAIALPKEITIDLQTAPTKEYYNTYHSLNNKLNELVLAGERLLKKAGFEAYAQTTDRVITKPGRKTVLPHKTVATRAGLGWIGKSCLLVTPQYGSAIRLSSLLTNAPLLCDQPINRSLCGKCDLCVKYCPAQALTGALWEAGMPRENIISVEKCRNKQLEIMVAATGIETDLCGKCFAVCRYTQKYIHG